MLIYDWGTQLGYLAFALWPRARIFPGKRDDYAPHILPEIEAVLAPGEMFIFHICLTHPGGWPKGRDKLLKWLASRGSQAVNGMLRDVSKKRIQWLNNKLSLPTTQVDHTCHPDLPVIIKTNFNYGGHNERFLTAKERAYLKIPFGDPRIKRYDEYEICNASDVFEGDWHDRHLTIERYVRNRRNAFYRCYFVGSRIVLSEAINARPIQKMRTDIPRTNFLVVDKEIDIGEPYRTILDNSMRFRRAIALDYGALDIVLDDDDTPYIIDVNPTPGWGAENQPSMIEHLRAGFAPDK
ncbi:hypothetical protein [Azospirillum aestuarii]|uniref:hypothetical protein n=1 Tax=Azospirillum aestuarii TaxID=2802052 RepID=UPI004054B575